MKVQIGPEIVRGRTNGCLIPFGTVWQNLLTIRYSPTATTGRTSTEYTLPLAND